MDILDEIAIESEDVVLDAIVSGDLDQVRAAGFEVLAWTPDDKLGKDIVLDAEAFAEFSAMVENPPEANAALRALLGPKLARCANHNLEDCPQCGAYLVLAEPRKCSCEPMQVSSWTGQTGWVQHKDPGCPVHGDKR